MHLEHTTLCDHVCSICVRAERIDGEVHMPVSEAQRHIDRVAPRFLSLNGIGEPLLHPQWDQIVEYAVQKHGAQVGFATTGVHLKAQADRICRSGLGLVKISFHGASATTFAKLSSGRSLERVKEGIRSLMAARSKLGRGPQIRLNYVVSEESFAEIPEVVELGVELGVDAIYFKGDLTFRNSNQKPAEGWDRERLTGALTAGDDLARKHQLPTNLARWVRKSSERSESRLGALPVLGRCLIPWISVFIRVDGTVLPCCNFTFSPGESSMGRIGVDGDFETIWRGANYAELRDEVGRGGASLEACRTCPDPVSLLQIGEAGLGGLWPGFLTQSS